MNCLGKRWNLALELLLVVLLQHKLQTQPQPPYFSRPSGLDDSTSLPLLSVIALH